LGNRRDTSKSSLKRRQFNNRSFLNVKTHGVRVRIDVKERSFDHGRHRPGRLFTKGQSLYQTPLSKTVLYSVQECRRPDLAPMEKQQPFKDQQERQYS
jgi:hypothetical protein